MQLQGYDLIGITETHTTETPLRMDTGSLGRQGAGASLTVRAVPCDV